MAKTPGRMRALVPVLFGLALLLVAVVGIWLTWPASWTPEPVAEGPRERVGVERRPRWTRPPQLPAVPGLGVELPPASRVEFDPAEEEPVEDTGSEAFGPATITGWLVDSRGADVGGGSLSARCTLVGEGGELLRSSGRTGAAADESGYFELSVTGPAVCYVRGFRRDGLLNAMSPPVELWIEPGEELEIDVIVPAARTGGIGIAFRPHPDGARVVRVHEGTPAFEAGLRRGDLIVAVDGQPTGELGEGGFVEAMTGPEGSEVVFTVQFEEGGEIFEEQHRVRRRFLDEAMIR